MSGKFYKRIYKARAELVVLCIKQIGCEATNRELSFLSGITIDRVSETLGYLEGKGELLRHGQGPARRLELVLVDRRRRRGPVAGEAKSLEELAGLAPNRRPKLRACISCESLFKSAHAGNRMCDGCRRIHSDNPFEGV